MQSTGPRVFVERTAVLVKPESVRGVDANPDPLTDAFLVGNVEIGLDPQTLERDVYRPSFSPTPGQVGRKVMTLSFTHEIKGSGDPNTRPKLGTLLNGCRLRETLVLPGASTQINDPIPAGAITGPEVSFSKESAPASHYGSYLLRVVEGGSSGNVKVQVFRWNQSDEDTSVLMNSRHDAQANWTSNTTITLDDSDETELVFTIGGAVTEGDTLYAVIGGAVFRHTVTAGQAGGPDAASTVAAALASSINSHALLSATATSESISVTFSGNAEPLEVTSASTPIPLGDSGAEITMSWTGSLAKGQMWICQLYEPGYMYLPTSDSEGTPTMTIHAYIDGQLYRMTAALGTVTLTGTAGEYGSAQFEFTGDFNNPVQEPLPTNLRYELSNPPKVELAEMSIRGNQDFCAESFTITFANDITERLCINAADGYSGSEISGRSPSASVNPEGTHEIYTNMWGDFVDGEEVPVHLRVGTRLNNMVRFYMDNATYSGIALSDRNRTQVMEPTFQLNGVSSYGDDELRIVFPVTP